jgi:hypothetical protein
MSAYRPQAVIVLVQSLSRILAKSSRSRSLPERLDARHKGLLTPVGRFASEGAGIHERFP